MDATFNERRDEVFRNCEVEIDGCVFRDCRFENAVLKYDGGKSRFIGCTFAGYRIEYGPNLNWAFEFMREFAHFGGRDSVEQLVAKFSAFMRDKPPPAVFTIE